MKALSAVLLMTAAGLVQAGEPANCGSAVQAAVGFMTATYGGSANDVLVQVASAKKTSKSPLVAEVFASAGSHKCALTLSPVSPRQEMLPICEWSLQVVNCDTPEVLKHTVVDEPSWAASKASMNTWREQMDDALRTVISPPLRTN